MECHVCGYAKTHKHGMEVGDGWIAMSLADSRGLILAARVGKHTTD